MDDSPETETVKLLANPSQEQDNLLANPSQAGGGPSHGGVNPGQDEAKKTQGTTKPGLVRPYCIAVFRGRRGRARHFWPVRSF